ncbi:PRD domain-containing protein [Klebsiella sp. 2680]|uniref:PRD domain-containing protein n=1 Tax=Klebsiella sp. 2680 TaxID=2018037 RepID=UPI00115AA035|nr:PRD domain-containing protein [Klebsiella sp. 2680]
MKVIKVLNNSLVMIEDDEGKEAIVMGKGIGFSSRVGDIIPTAKVEKLFVVQENLPGAEYLSAFAAMPEEIFQMTGLVMQMAQQELSYPLRPQIFFTLTDHLMFAVERSRKGIMLQNRVLFEVQRFWPAEFSLAQKVVNRLNHQFMLDLPPEEAGNIAFHLVNGQSEHNDTRQTLQAMRMLKDIFNIIQYHAAITIDTNSLNYSRFLIHMQFFIQRMFTGQLNHSQGNTMLEQIAHQHPRMHRCALVINDYVKQQLEVEITDDELLWLIVHLVRISEPATAQ